MAGRALHSAKEVFTPTIPARLTFVERESINDKLVNALRTPGKQLVVYGHSGCGKSTLLANKLEQIYGAHVNSRCMRGVSFDQLILDAFDQLGVFYVSERTAANKREISAEVTGEYLGIKSQLTAVLENATESKQQRFLPPQLTPQTLSRLLGEAGCCWVLEDFHKVDECEKVKISQVMKVFMDMADSYRDLKIIAVGAVDTARQVVQYDTEMRNRVAEIHVPLMTTAEIGSIIHKGEALLNINFGEGIRRGVIHYSNGLASVCHHFCLNLCAAAGIEETSLTEYSISPDHLKTALTQYLEEASDTLKYAFDKAFKRKKSRTYDNCRAILNALSRCSQEGATNAEILKEIRQVFPSYPQGNLTLYLRQLHTEERGSIVRYDSVSGKFAFADPIYRAFCLAYFERQPIRPMSGAILVGNESVDFSEVLQMISKNADRFLKDWKLYEVPELPLESPKSS